MYEIYINENLLLLGSTQDYLNFSESDAFECYRYNGKVKTLHHYIDTLEKSNQKKQMLIYYSDLKQLKSEFKGLFRKIKAAGGIVRNTDNEILFIFRRGFWDLPKGKMEEGEGKRWCALREVKEETGLQSLQITRRVGKTRHSYKHPKTGQRILKITYWYAMLGDKADVLHVQTEEDITEAKWMNLDTFFGENYTTFASIISILNKYSTANAPE